jgi:hypothetical protein
MQKRIVVAGVICVFVVACATSRQSGGRGGGVDTSAFPSAQRVEEIANAPLPPVAPIAGQAVDTWTFQSLPATSFSDVPVASMTPFEQRVFGTRTTTMAARCIAAELAEYVVNDTAFAFPDRRFQQHLLGRCGSAAASFGMSNMSVPDAGKHNESDIEQELANGLRKQAADASGDVGVAIGKKGKRRVGVFVHVPIAVRMEPSPRTAQNGVVQLRGSIVDAADIELLIASVNQGRTGSAPCIVDPAVSLPAFHLSCPVDAADATAGIVISAKKRGRILANHVTSTFVLPGAATSKQWDPVVFGDAAPLPTDVAERRAAVVARINGVRSGAGLAPLVDAAAQSATTQKLASKLFHPANQNDGALLDDIALGILAGYNLDVAVSDASLSISSIGGATLDRFVGDMLDSASMREALMSKEAGVIALALEPSGPLTSTVAVTWERYIERPAAEVQQRAFDALKAERARRGLGPLGEVPVENAVAQASLRLSRSEEMMPVLQGLLDATVDAMHYPFMGWAVEVADETLVPWPAELLTTSPTYVAVASGMKRRPGSPWATTVVVIVGYVQPQQTAMR